MAKIKGLQFITNLESLQRGLRVEEVDEETSIKYRGEYLVEFAKTGEVTGAYRILVDEEVGYHIHPVSPTTLTFLEEAFGQEEDRLERVDIAKLHKQHPQRGVF